VLSGLHPLLVFLFFVNFAAFPLAVLIVPCGITNRTAKDFVSVAVHVIHRTEAFGTCVFTIFISHFFIFIYL
jgi:hypothetical protein